MERQCKEECGVERDEGRCACARPGTGMTPTHQAGTVWDNGSEKSEIYARK